MARNVGVPVGAGEDHPLHLHRLRRDAARHDPGDGGGLGRHAARPLKEFEAIIAAVIGGVLLTGGYGTVFGATFGALIFGLVQMGIFYTGIDTDWFKVFLGLVILVAVLVNNYIRAKALGGGRAR